MRDPYLYPDFDDIENRGMDRFEESFPPERDWGGMSRPGFRNRPYPPSGGMHRWHRPFHSEFHQPERYGRPSRRNGFRPTGTEFRYSPSERGQGRYRFEEGPHYPQQHFFFDYDDLAFRQSRRPTVFHAQQDRGWFDRNLYVPISHREPRYHGPLFYRARPDEF